MGQRVKRFENWQPLLIESIKSKIGLDFKYGEHDCCLSICDNILAMTGVDVAEEFRGYTTLAEAKVFRKKHKGVRGIAEYITKKFNFPEILPGFAGAGDVVLVQDDKKEFHLSMVELNGIKVITAEDGGWNYWDRTEIVKAWKIG